MTGESSNAGILQYDNRRRNSLRLAWRFIRPGMIRFTPASHGLGISKTQSLWCSARKRPAFSICVMFELGFGQKNFTADVLAI